MNNASLSLFKAGCARLLQNCGFKFSSKDLTLLYYCLMAVNEQNVERCLADVCEMIAWEEDLAPAGELGVEDALYAFALDNFENYFRDYCRGEVPYAYAQFISKAKCHFAKSAEEHCA